MSVSRGTPRKRVNGGNHVVEVHHHAHAHARLKHMPVSAGLSVSSKPRPVLGDEEIDRMLAAAEREAEEEESEGEICLPGRVGVVGV